MAECSPQFCMHKCTTAFGVVCRNTERLNRGLTYHHDCRYAQHSDSFSTSRPAIPLPTQYQPKGLSARRLPAVAERLGHMNPTHAFRPRQVCDRSRDA